MEDRTVSWTSDPPRPLRGCTRIGTGTQLREDSLGPLRLELTDRRTIDLHGAAVLPPSPPRFEQEAKSRSSLDGGPKLP